MAALVAAVPHVLILALMTLEILRTSGTDRAFAALYGFAEFWVIPPALLGALLLRLTTRWRAWPAGIMTSTIAGSILVAATMFIIGRAGTWT